MLDSSYKSLLWGSSIWKQTCFMRSISKSIFVPGRRHCTEPRQEVLHNTLRTQVFQLHSHNLCWEGPAPSSPWLMPHPGPRVSHPPEPAAASGPRRCPGLPEAELLRVTGAVGTHRGRCEGMCRGQGRTAGKLSVARGTGISTPQGSLPPAPGPEHSIHGSWSCH